MHNTDPPMTPAETIHRKLYANSEVKKRNWPDVYEEEIGEIAAGLHAAFMEGEQSGFKRGVKEAADHFEKYAAVVDGKIVLKEALGGIDGAAVEG